MTVRRASRNTDSLAITHPSSTAIVLGNAVTTCCLRCMSTHATIIAARHFLYALLKATSLTKVPDSSRAVRVLSKRPDTASLHDTAVLANEKLTKKSSVSMSSRSAGSCMASAIIRTTAVEE